MARGVALSAVVASLRNETGRNTSTAANAGEESELKHVLSRQQEFYYDDYDWPHLQVQRAIPLVQNQRFYDFPSDMNAENIEGIYRKVDGYYQPLIRGITLDDYNERDSLQATAATGTVTVTGGTLSAGVNKFTSITVDGVEVLGADVDHTGDNATTAAALAAQINTFTSSPEYTATSSGAVVTISAKIAAGTGANTFVVAVTAAGDATATKTDFSGGVNAEQDDPLKWDLLEDEESGALKVEFWPVPIRAEQVFMLGKRNLKAFAADADTCDLDDMLLYLSGAAELLARAGHKDAATKGNLAQARYHQVKKRTTEGHGQGFKMGAGRASDRGWRDRGPTITVSRG